MVVWLACVDLVEKLVAVGDVGALACEWVVAVDVVVASLFVVVDLEAVALVVVAEQKQFVSGKKIYS